MSPRTFRYIFVALFVATALLYNASQLDEVIFYPLLAISTCAAWVIGSLTPLWFETRVRPFLEVYV